MRSRLSLARRALLASALLVASLALFASVAAAEAGAASLHGPVALSDQSSRLADGVLHDLAALKAARSLAAAPPWLDEINRYRVAAGLTPVTEQPAWKPGLEHHLTYLAKTPPEYYTGSYVSLHTENPASPYYTADGDLEAGCSNIMSGGTASEVDAIDVWWVAPFHAIGMLRAQLGQVELGYATTGADLDVLQGLDYTLPEVTTPILFPGPGVTTNLVRFGGELPDPRETLGWQQQDVGLPLIALLPQAPDPGLTASLTRPDGPPETSATGDLGIVDERTYVSSDPTYGSTGLSILAGEHAVLLIPRHPLANGAYSVRIQQPGQADVTWSFSVITTPTLSDFSPTFGTVGASVTLTGTGLAGATAVTFHGTSARYTVDSDTDITATVPAGATSGTIAVTTPGGTATSATSFSVTPTPTPTPTLKLSGLRSGAMKLGRSVTATGKVTPTSLAGSKVRLTVQKRGARWVTLKSVARTISLTGAYSWKYKPARRGAYRMRATIAKTATHTAATTTWRTFKVK